MIRVKMLPRNEVAIIENGKTYLFNNVGRCIQEDAGFVGKYMDGSLDLPIISLLSSGSNLEFALFEPNKEMRRFKTSIDSMGCAMKVQMNGGFVRMLRHDGVSNNIKYNQLIFIFQTGTSLESYISLLEGEEVFD